MSHHTHHESHTALLMLAVLLFGGGWLIRAAWRAARAALSQSGGKPSVSETPE